MLKIASWNVNGIRAAAEKGLIDWMDNSSYDVICIQETKADTGRLKKELLDSLTANGRKAFFSSAKRPGYSGVALFCKNEPLKVSYLDVAEFDDEGRYIEADFGNYIVASAYFPNSQEKGARLAYKLGFCDAVFSHLSKIVKNGKHIILCGDYNIAHKSIDLAHPNTNEQNPGYLPEERDWMTFFLANGYSDSFRVLYPDKEKCYSWWSYRMRAREKNVGWRIDYACVDAFLTSKIKSAGISTEVMGSDHCPVTIELDI